MKRRIFTLMLAASIMALFAVTASAQGPAKNTVQNFSPVQLFTPDPQYSAAVAVGTGKSTLTYTIGRGQSAYYVNCYSADRTIPATVNVAMNGSTTHKVLLGTGTLGPFGVNNTGKGTAVSSLTFTGYTTAAAKYITCEVWGQ